MTQPVKILHMSLSLFSFQGETPNLCACTPYPRLYTGGGGGGMEVTEQASE